MKTWKDCLRVCVAFALLALLVSCSLNKSNNAEDSHLTKIVVLNDNMAAYCDKQNNIEHKVVAGELDAIFTQQQTLISLYGKMKKQSKYNKDLLKIIDNEIADIDMMFGEYKNGSGSIPEKYYVLFSSYLKQINVNLQIFMEHM